MAELEEDIDRQLLSAGKQTIEPYKIYLPSNSSEMEQIALLTRYKSVGWRIDLRVLPYDPRDPGLPTDYWEFRS